MWHRNRGRERDNNRREFGNNSGNRRGNRGFHSRGFRDGGRNFRFRDHDNYRNNDFTHKRDRQKSSFENVVEKLNETEIGVTEFISNLEGFTGILKSRYSDFQVNEIDMDGKIAKLSNFEIPKDPEPEREEEDDDILVNRYRIEQLPIETWDKIHKMIEKKDLNEIVEIDVTQMTKEDRTKIHEAVKLVFGQKIVGSTITKGDQKFIVIKLFNKSDRVDRREKWPKSRGGEYVYFLVYKEYTDTIEANIQLSECLNLRPSNFCYAGVKDRRAKTTQWFCTRKIDPRRLLDCTSRLRHIRIGNFCYKTETLKLGQLKGNRFRIALRNVTASNDVIDKALEFLKNNGFINYYGLQRFGNCKDIPTHQIGIELLKGNWKEAVKLILKPRKYEQERDIGAAKQFYEKTGNAAKAYAMLEKKRNRCIEGRLLGGLGHAENDYVNALEKVPRNMRLLYIHAFQSFIWNKIVSRRIKEFGMKPMVGDIIIEGDYVDNFEIIEGTDEGENENDSENKEKEKDILKKQIKVKFLTESDLPNYTIYDIVLPLPGYDISYPANTVKDWYEELLGEYGLTLEMPKQRVKTYTLSGNYRKILERVSDFSWKIMRYDDHTATLIRSDYEEIIGKPEPKSIPDGKYKALVLDFCLSSSCYATMALREVMKMDTSVETHMNLDNSTQKNNSTITNTNNEASVKLEPKSEEIQDKKSKIEKCKIEDTNKSNETNQIKNNETSVVLESKSEEIENKSNKIEKEDTNDVQTADKRKLPVDTMIDHKKMKTEEKNNTE